MKSDPSKLGEILRKFRKLRKKKVELGTLVWTPVRRTFAGVFQTPGVMVFRPAMPEVPR